MKKFPHLLNEIHYKFNPGITIFLLEGSVSRDFRLSLFFLSPLKLVGATVKKLPGNSALSIFLFKCNVF